MRIIKRIFFGLLILLVLFGIGMWIFSNSLKPTYNGTMKINGLSDKVEVLFDDYGVPHIYAQNELDAQRALGYVHAQDRLWQMELMRRIGAGRLSEILGPDLIDTDKFFLGLGIDDNARATIADLDKNNISYQLTAAYLDGINQYIENGATPLEFYAIGIEKEKFTINDIYNILGYMSFSFAQAHRIDPMVYHIQQKLGDKYVQELGLDVDSNYIKTPIHYKVDLGTKMSEAVGAIMRDLPVPPFIGSNGWIVGPKKSKSGQVIFCNDPHIGYSQPSVWYQAYIKTPKHEIYGNYLALTPFPLIGHNHHHAYGLTMFENDDLDFYLEKVNPDNPNEYLTPNGYKSFETKQKTIKVKDQDDVVFEVRSSAHGPIMNELIQGFNVNHPVAMDWIYTKYKSKNLDAFYGASHAKTMSEFEHYCSKIVAPGLNVLYGDADGNIAWWAVGKLYHHKQKVNTKTILDGSNGLDDQLEYLPFSVNPQSINPPENYILSANNQHDTIAGSLYPGYYLPTDRAKRIFDLLDKKQDVTSEYMTEMIHDITSSTAPDFVKVILKNSHPTNPTFETAISLLKDWKGDFSINSAAPTIYTKFLYEYSKNTFMDELGASIFPDFLSVHMGLRLTRNQIYKKSSIWWDDISTKDKIETRADIIQKSMESTIDTLINQLGHDVSRWQWKNVCTLEHKHPIGKKVAALREAFNVGPFHLDGGNEVLNNQIFTLNGTGIYNVTGGPSSRRIIDFSNIENSMGIIPTGQSGNPLSKHYRDLAPFFNSKKLVRMIMKKEDLKGDVLILK